MENEHFYGNLACGLDGQFVSMPLLVEDLLPDPGDDDFMLLGMDLAFRLLLLEAGLTGSVLAMSERQARIAAAVNEAWDALRREVCLSLAKDSDTF